MARFPGNELLYKVFQEFLKLCLIENRSLLWPDKEIWTPEHVSDVKRRMVDGPIWGNDLTFEEKLKKQMTNASPELWGIITDIYYIYLLPSTFIKYETKHRDIEWAAEQGVLVPPPPNASIWEAQKIGFTRTGQKYHLKYAQFWFILYFANHVKGLQNPGELFDDYLELQKALDNIIENIPNKSDRAYDMRHAVLYMTYPDLFERIISTSDKENILNTYKNNISGPVPMDLDEAIRRIRKTLSVKYDKPDCPFDFYRDLKQDGWKPKKKILKGAATVETETGAVTVPLGTRSGQETCLLQIGNKGYKIDGVPRMKGDKMARSILDRFTEEERRQLIERLLVVQGKKSYISGKEIDLRIDQVEVDHIIALDRGGDDDESNWGVVKASENSSKGKRDLQLLKYIYQFRSHRDKYLTLKRDFTFGDALGEVYPTREDVIYDLTNNTITLKYKSKGETMVLEYPILSDSLDKSVKSFVGMVPFEIVNHDAGINPRSIVDLEVMIEEFYHKNPQLFPSLATLDVISDSKAKIMAFDGQHKAAAQLYLRSKALFLRIFVNVDKAKIKKTNLRAHTVVAQIHFPKLIEDKVGHDLFSVEFEPFADKVDHTKSTEIVFIKQDELSDEYRNYLGNYYKYNALIDEDGERHSILEFVETISARSKNYPISYDTLSKTFLRMIYLKPSEEILEKSIPLRRSETGNLRKIMALFVEKVLKDKFDVQTGIFKIEEKLIEEPNSIADDHLIGYRICRQAAFLVWINEFRKAITRLLVSRNRYANAKWRDERVLWAGISEDDFRIIGNMFDVIRKHRIWKIKENKEILASLGSTKQSDWKAMLLDGKLPGREERLLDPLNDTVIYDKAISI